MSEVGRLLRYTRPYAVPLAASIVLMSAVGASQALMVRLIPPLFDRVLSPTSSELPVKLFTVPFLGWVLHLGDLMPAGVHNIWTSVAIGIIFAFLVKGLCDYAANYIINYVGFSAVTDIRQQVFERVLHQDASFFQENSTGGLMSSIMSDIDKIQVAVSHLLADWFRQFFSVTFLLAAVLQANWRLALVALTVLLVVIVGLAVWLYEALMTSSSKQGTLGKMAFRMKVTDLNGRRISFGRATGRFFAKILSGILYIGYIMAGFTERKQALHDMIAGTLVVRG